MNLVTAGLSHASLLTRALEQSVSRMDCSILCVCTCVRVRNVIFCIRVYLFVLRVLTVIVQVDLFVLRVLKVIGKVDLLLLRLLDRDCYCHNDFHACRIRTEHVRTGGDSAILEFWCGAVRCH